MIGVVLRCLTDFVVSVANGDHQGRGGYICFFPFLGSVAKKKDHMKV